MMRESRCSARKRAASITYTHMAARIFIAPLSHRPPARRVCFTTTYLSLAYGAKSYHATAVPRPTGIATWYIDSQYAPHRQHFRSSARFLYYGFCCQTKHRACRRSPPNISSRSRVPMLASHLRRSRLRHQRPP